MSSRDLLFARVTTGAVPGILLGMAMGLNKTVRMMLDATVFAGRRFDGCKRPV